LINIEKINFKEGRVETQKHVIARKKLEAAIDCRQLPLGVWGVLTFGLAEVNNSLRGRVGRFDSLGICLEIALGNNQVNQLLGQIDV